MGDCVADDWDSAQMREIARTELSELNQNEEDVPDDWEDEPEEQPEPPPQPSKIVKKTVRCASVKTLHLILSSVLQESKPAASVPDFSKMTEKEKAQYQAEQVHQNIQFTYRRYVGFSVQEMKAYGYTEMGGSETDVSLLMALKCADESSIKATTSELMRKVSLFSLLR